MGLLSALFGPKVDLKQWVKEGAIILDVRTPGEFNGGHVKGSKNIPLQTLQQQLSKLPKDKKIITCCASGNRSGMAKRILQSSGFEVVNGGSWMSVNNKIR